MADINQVITLGIGAPSGIAEFLTFGLQLGLEAPNPWTVQSNSTDTWTNQTNSTDTWTDQTNSADTWTFQ